MTITYSDFILQGNHVLDNISRLKSIGADRVELLMDGTCWDNNNWDRLADELLATGLTFTVHPPSSDTNLTAEMFALREAAFKLYSDAICFAKKIHAKSVVLHPGFVYSSHFDKERAKATAREYLLKLVEISSAQNVRLLVENVGFSHVSLYTQEEYTHLLDDVDEIAGYLIDIGHAHINHWEIPKLINDVSGRLYGMHIHDNSQKTDNHLHIGRGTVEWEPVFEAMRNVRADCDFILEYSPDAVLNELVEGKKILNDQVLAKVNITQT